MTGSIYLFSSGNWYWCRYLKTLMCIWVALSMLMNIFYVVLQVHVFTPWIKHCSKFLEPIYIYVYVCEWWVEFYFVLRRGRLFSGSLKYLVREAALEPTLHLSVRPHESFRDTPDKTLLPGSAHVVRPIISGCMIWFDLLYLHQS